LWTPQIMQMHRFRIPAQSIKKSLCHRWCSTACQQLFGALENSLVLQQQRNRYQRRLDAIIFASADSSFGSV
jgi:hypothetical protein